jgi:hypothetical protein
MSVQAGNLEEYGEGKMLEETADKTAGARRRASSTRTPPGINPSTSGSKPTTGTKNSKPMSPIQFGHPFHSTSDFRRPRFENRSKLFLQTRLSRDANLEPQKRTRPLKDQSRLEALDDMVEPAHE